MTDIMLDLETLGVDSNSVVISISAVEFNRKTGKIGREFEIGLDATEQEIRGGIINQSTLDWWAEQSVEARKELARLERHPVDVALKAYAVWIDKSKATTVWGNGATFDNVILENLFKRHNVAYPTKFWDNRCVRTLCDLLRINPKKTKFVGVPHRGLDDCKHQITYCMKGFKPNTDDCAEEEKVIECPSR